MNINNLSHTRPVIDGKVDRKALASLAGEEEALTDIQDQRVTSILSDKVKEDATSLGDGWTGRYSDLPIYGRRGIEGLKQWSTFKSDHQKLEVSWHENSLSLETEAPGAEVGHRIEARLNRSRAVEADSIQESFYIISDR